jgi:soluble lytic murein transglycosylase-like protein
VLQLVASLALAVTALPSMGAEVAVLKNGFAIRHERHEVIGATTRLFLSSSEHSGYVDIASESIGSFEPDETPVVAATAAGTPAIAQPVGNADYIKAASEKHRIDRALIESIIHAESAFNPKAVSRKGAKGLMQLMPSTAAELGVSDVFDPRTNVDAGTRYLQQLLIKYNNNLAKALAAYNAGPLWVEQYNGVPPFRETHNYVRRVITEFNRKKLAEPGAQTLAFKPAHRSSKTTAKTAAGSSSSGQR